jgi:hypothetical protein
MTVCTRGSHSLIDVTPTFVSRWRIRRIRHPLSEENQTSTFRGRGESDIHFQRRIRHPLWGRRIRHPLSEENQTSTLGGRIRHPLWGESDIHFGESDIHFQENQTSTFRRIRHPLSGESDIHFQKENQTSTFRGHFAESDIQSNSDKYFSSSIGK